ncbi:MAG: aldo/keto reductase [Thermoprotei archaeon]|nr:aldo/keto reductase [Thermoprotei archaeon]
MEYTNLGGTEVKVSRVGLGAWQFSDVWGVKDYDVAKSIIAKALESGVNFIDTAVVYGRGLSEQFIGKALRELNVRRDDVVIATKIPGEFLSPHDVFKAVERSLSRLQTSYIDMLLVHWPPCWHHIPTCVYMRALERLVNLGKVNYLGLSDYPVELVDAARMCLSRVDIEALQVRFNLAERWAEEEHIPYAEENEMTVMAWSPLAKGAITGKYSLEEVQKLQDLRVNEPLFQPSNYPQVLELASIVKSIASKYGKTPAQVALNWLISYSDVIVPIPGARNPQQVEENAGSVGWRLTYEDWRALDEASRKLRITYATF